MTNSTVMTVRGSIPAKELGVTLMHEHIIVNLLKEFRLDGLLNDVELATKELTYFRDAGGSTVVDLTNDCFGRQPETLKKISELTGLNIIMGCGLYRHQYFDVEWVDRNSTDSIAKWIVRDLTVGVGESGIRAGIIGEVGCDEWITAQEERSFRAAARAHLETGVSINIHAARWPVGLTILELLSEEGVNLDRVIVSHCDTVSSPRWISQEDVMDYHEKLAKQGAYVEFDTIRHAGHVIDYELQTRINYIRNLIEKGYAHNILISHDIAFRSMLQTSGGSGYSFILTNFVPRMRASGISEELIQLILIDNPRRALTGK